MFSLWKPEGIQMLPSSVLLLSDRKLPKGPCTVPRYLENTMQCTYLHRRTASCSSHFILRQFVCFLLYVIITSKSGQGDAAEKN